jgi:hypothetical protein
MQRDDGKFTKTVSKKAEESISRDEVLVAVAKRRLASPTHTASHAGASRRKSYNT